MDTKKTVFLSVSKIPPALVALAKEMGISFHACQLPKDSEHDILPPETEPDIVLTDISSISKIKQQITRWTKHQKPVLVFGTGSSKQQGQTLPQFKTRNGMIFCQTLSGMLNLAKAFCSPFQVQDPGVTILTNSGSLGVLGSDLCEQEGLYQTIPDSSMLQQLQTLLSRHVPLYNPIQFGPQTSWDTLQKILSSMLEDKRTANLLLLLTPAGNAWEQLTKNPRPLLGLIQDSQIPVHLCFLSSAEDKQTQKFFLQAGVPCHESPECAVQSIRVLFDFSTQNSKNKGGTK